MVVVHMIIVVYVFIVSVWKRGSSILVILILSLVERWLALDFFLKAIFENSAIREFACYIIRIRWI